MREFIVMRGRLVAAAIVGLVLFAVSGSHATEVYKDSVFANGGLQLGATELFVLGPYGAPGSWGCTNAVLDDMSVCKLTTEGGTGNGCHGASVHLAYPDAFAKHGSFEHGHVLRLSCWLAVDASEPVNRQDWQFAVLKFEFYRDALANPHDQADARLFDSDIDTDGELVTSYADSLSPTAWKRFSLEYAVDTNQVDLAELAEVRPVIVQGDFAGGEFSGNVLIGDLKVEVFKNQTAADAAPLNAPAPGDLPAAKGDS